MENEEKREHECYENCGCAACAQEQGAHHHVHGHESGCGCAACHAVDDIFSENEEDEKKAQSEFRREVTFLAVAGAVFVPTLICEALFPDVAPEWLFNAVFAVLYLLTGVPVLKIALKALLRGDVFNEFTLMGGATLAALAIGEMSESVGVMLFYRLGEAFQERASSNSRRSIRALLAQKPMTARVVTEDGTVEKDPKEIVKGDVVRVMPGEIVPIDGRVVSGTSQIDMSAITGESMPVAVRRGSEVHGGTLSLDGLLTVEAAGPFEDSTIARMLEMVQNAVARKSPTERFITRFSKWYTPAVFFMASAVMLLPPLLGFGAWREWIYRGLVLLVISCPCALVISIPLGYFGGIGAASKNGILVKGANVFDAVGRVDTAVFDKTGTLTYGKFRLVKIVPAAGIEERTVLSAAALAENGSTHPVAKSITAAAADVSAPEGASITQLPGKGMLFKNEGDTIVAGNAALLSEFGVAAPAVAEHGTVVHVMKNGKYLGALVVADELRTDAAKTISELRMQGIKGVYMLTGDREETAADVAKELRLDGYRAELLPGDKVEALKELCGGDTKRTVYVGDGINDGPVLVTSETGIAMGGFGSQVAVEVADAVILDDSPSKVVGLLRIAKKTRAIVWENVFLALGVKLVFLIFGVAGLAGLWEAVFADVGVALMAILNSARATRIK
ncbi:heavy metal translocating P-type ATPase [Synergistes jonesii]|uniref:Zinc ABC transporter ATPase n=2 Tax=Synergistes jonesii TaxID=2754 RepID=A0A073J593_9BACT|nr:heavy metal translocating P-type ATPase [Synergistes jonesii]KEJ92887.1 zinc ABC transporter ATPase [Synergistes jonesii]OFB64173.1 zinc ABC transporter ATPase [Synergistes jonesii]OFB64650.1 zinc ABC transporter ATPase [Synergistes jonesii]OFB65395.1 zinc ABC transporter ATPase [Synergistes jonesii]OFB68435.1 zinc ABC transporter ATPase [Synergistes jonesii]